MAHRITWNGTPEEGVALLQAFQAHCECQTDKGRTVAPCVGHTVLAHDQRTLNGLLFMRRIVAKLLSEEFDVPPQFQIEPSTTSS